MLSQTNQGRRRYRSNSTVASSYNSGDIGAVPPFLATTLGENYVYYISRVTTNFHAQRLTHRAKATPNGFITNALHPRVRHRAPHLSHDSSFCAAARGPRRRPTGRGDGWTTRGRRARATGPRWGGRARPSRSCSRSRSFTRYVSARARWRWEERDDDIDAHRWSSSDDDDDDDDDDGSSDWTDDGDFWERVGGASV